MLFPLTFSQKKRKNRSISSWGLQSEKMLRNWVYLASGDETILYDYPVSRFYNPTVCLETHIVGEKKE